MSAPTLLGKYAPGTDEWWTVRRGRIGGSDIAAILGLSAWQSPFSLWWLHQGSIPPQPENDGMEWGKRLEPVIVEKFREAHPEVTVGYPVNHVYAHPERQWQVASPDGLLYANDSAEHFDMPLAGLEVKTDHVSQSWEWGEPGTDEIPPAYRAQVDWYLDVFELDAWHVAVLIGGSDYREYKVTADADRAQHARTAARAFLDSLESEQVPDIDTHSATYTAIRQLHPEIDGEDVEISAALAEAYCLSRVRLSLAEGDARLATSLLADAMGNARRARFCGQTIATRQARGEGTPYLVAGRNLPTFDTEDAA